MNEIDVISTLISSGILIGDVNYLTPSSNVVAVQAEQPEGLDKLITFENFDVFTAEPSEFLPPVNVETFFYSNQPIYVDALDVFSASTSGVIQVGGTGHVHSIARTKHIRRLDEEPTF
ncbi:spore germination protein GerPE [Halobacillus litoralis]|uniref:spore germination protein GerPE n=1 Tax=Halobacillus litoralis TaxID=45668 RepID=UPI001CD41EF0|nr:spore germination protein GerPE [Halobacillus litoralis]MCA0969635.1 spore germination protein GerPE [Halobacillus litoralis]